MTLKIFDSLPPALARFPAPHLALLDAITQCNRDKTYYITPDFHAAKKNTRREKGAPLDEVVAAFNSSISQLRIADIPKADLDRARVQVLTYIDQAVGITLHAKADTRTGFLTYIDLAIERKRPLQWLERIVGSTETVNEVDVDFLKAALTSMALERACMLKLALQMAGHYYYQNTMRQLKTLGLSLNENRPGVFNLNWLGILGYTMEEIAIGFVLGKLLTRDFSRCRKLVMELQEKDFESRASYEKAMRDWHMMLCYDQCYRLTASLIIPHANMQALIAPNRAKISDEIADMVESINFLRTTPTLPWNTVFQPVVRYQAQVDKLNNLYQKGFNLYSKFTHQDDPQIPPPSVFAALKMPVSLQGVAFEPEIDTSDAELLQTLLNSLFAENSLTQKALLDILSNKSQAIEPLYQALDAHHKAAREAVMKKLAEIKPAEAPSPTPKAYHPRRKLKKLIKETSSALPTSPPPVAKTKPVEYVPPHWLEDMNKEPLWLAQRVRDWMQKTPAALQKEPYLTLREPEKEDAVFRHTYPLIVTKILRKFVKPELWRSPTHHKENILYKCAGFIERHGLNQQTVCFTDCFDKTTDELYHHCIQPIPLAELMSGRQINSGDILQEEASGQAQKEEISLYNRYKVTIRSFSILIDDEQTNTKYTLFCPTTE